MNVPGCWGEEVSLGNILNHQSAWPCPPLAAHASRDEVLNEIRGWCRGEQLGSVVNLNILRHDPRPVLQVELITFIDVDTPQFTGWATGRLETFLSPQFAPHLHFPDY